MTINIAINMYIFRSMERPDKITESMLYLFYWTRTNKEDTTLIQ